MFRLAREWNGTGLRGWVASSKFDGFRAVWLPETVGRPKGEFDWANSTRPEQLATGLWSRNGNVITAPKWWTDELPRIKLDGEIWSAMPRQQLRSICSRLEPDPGWADVGYYVFGMPEVLVNREIYRRLEKLQYGDVLKHVEQVLIESDAHLQELLDREMEKEYGEGLVVTDPAAYWSAGRVPSQMKVKPRQDSEGRVVGIITGTGALIGMMGCLVVQWRGRTLRIGTGFNHAERALLHPDWARDNPGVAYPFGTEGWNIITFRYNGLSLAGTPLCPAYWRRK